MSSVKIADNYNSDSNLQELQDISPTLFVEYSASDAVETEWHDAESINISGDGLPKLIGRPWCRWKFGRLTEGEVALLKTIGPEVTILTRNKTTEEYAIYNAVMDYIEVGELDWDLGGYDDVVVTFKYLVEIVIP